MTGFQGHKLTAARAVLVLGTTSLLAVAFSPPVEAAVLDVGSGQPYATITAALVDAQAGDVINVVDPVHTEYGIVVDKDVTIQGQGAQSTIVQAAETHWVAPDRVFLIPWNQVVTIRDMTVRHGNLVDILAYGGGIMVENDAALTLERAWVTWNRAASPDLYAAGGGIYNGTGSLTIRECYIGYNVAEVTRDYAGGGG